MNYIAYVIYYFLESELIKSTNMVSRWEQIICSRKIYLEKVKH